MFRMFQSSEDQREIDFPPLSITTTASAPAHNKQPRALNTMLVAIVSIQHGRLTRFDGLSLNSDSEHFNANSKDGSIYTLYSRISDYACPSNKFPILHSVIVTLEGKMKGRPLRKKKFDDLEKLRAFMEKHHLLSPASTPSIVNF